MYHPTSPPCALQNLQSLPHVGIKSKVLAGTGEIKSKILACMPLCPESLAAQRRHGRAVWRSPTSQGGPPQPPFARALIPFGDSDVRPSRPVALVPVNRCRLVGWCQPTRRLPPAGGNRARTRQRKSEPLLGRRAFYPLPEQSGARTVVEWRGGSRFRESDGRGDRESETALSQAARTAFSDPLSSSKIQTL